MDNLQLVLVVLTVGAVATSCLGIGLYLGNRKGG